MAQVDKKILFKMPVHPDTEITLLLDKDWHYKIARIWNRKKIERHIFRIKDEKHGSRWYECGPDLAKEIISTIHKADLGSDLSKDELTLELYPVKIKDISKQEKFLTKWEKIKRLFRRN